MYYIGNKEILVPALMDLNLVKGNEIYTLTIITKLSHKSVLEEFIEPHK